MNDSLRLGKILGIPINVHFSWFIIFFLVTWSLGAGYFPSEYRWSPALSWSVGLITSLLFFGSVLAHELAHSVLAVRYGIPVHSINLFIFGGVSQIGREAYRPGIEFRVALAGPLTSLALGGVLWALSTVAGPWNEPVAAITSYLGYINVVLALFNMVPGFPLDGGRVLRAVVWRLTRDFVKATRIATGIGRGIAYLLMAGGFVIALQGGVASGVWLVIIGWFLNTAAESSHRQLVVEGVLREVRVEDIMTRDYATVEPYLTLRQVVDEHLLRHRYHAFPVVADSTLLGIICLHDIKRVPQEEWPVTTVSGTMTPLAELIFVSPNTGGDIALQKLSEKKVGQLPVLEDGRVVGLVTRDDLLKLVRMRSELGV